MAWNLVLLETYCMCSPGKGDVPPAYCRFGPGRPDTYCFVGDDLDDVSVPCRYAAWSKARSTAVVTQEEGRVATSDAFVADLGASDLENERAERAWHREMVFKVGRGSEKGADA